MTLHIQLQQTTRPNLDSQKYKSDTVAKTDVKPTAAIWHNLGGSTLKIGPCGCLARHRNFWLDRSSPLSLWLEFYHLPYIKTNR
jgi:hypothetical protein